MLENLNKSLNSLMGGQKQFVGISITPHLGLEVACINYKDKLVTNYARVPLEYNPIQREIADYNELKQSLDTAFSQLGIDPSKSDACVVVPNIYFDIKELNGSITDDEKRMALLTDVEDSFLFKGKEVSIAFCDSGFTADPDGVVKNYIHSAIQEDQLIKIRQAIEEVGVNIVAIETSHSALLKGISYSGISDDAIKQHMNWNVLLVNNNSFAIFAFSGEHLKKYVEIPLAIKSLSYEEAYQAVTTAAVQNLKNFPAQKLVIVSQADEIGTEILRSNLKFDGEVEAFDFNRYTKKQIINTSSNVLGEDRKRITLNVIGGCIFKENELSIKLDFLNGENSVPDYIPLQLFDKQVNIAITTVRKALIAVGIVFLVVMLGLCEGSKLLSGNFNTKTGTNDEETQRLEKEIDAMRGITTGKSVDEEINKIVTTNKDVLATYTSIANEIPKNVWLTYFETSTGKNIFIEGMGMGIKDVHSYYRNLKTTDPSSTIELKELKIITDILTNTFDAESPEKRVYYFEIANMESIKERIAKGEKIDLGYEDKKEKKAGAFDWLDSYSSGGDGTGGTDGGMQSFSQEKPPAANDIQLESIKMDR